PRQRHERLAPRFARRIGRLPLCCCWRLPHPRTEWWDRGAGELSRRRRFFEGGGRELSRRVEGAERRCQERLQSRRRRWEDVPPHRREESRRAGGEAVRVGSERVSR